MLEPADDGASGDLDISATLAEDEQTLTLFVVNRSAKIVSQQFDVSTIRPDAAEIEVVTLADTQQPAQ